MTLALTMAFEWLVYREAVAADEPNQQIGLDLAIDSQLKRES